MLSELNNQVDGKNNTIINHCINGTEEAIVNGKHFEIQKSTFQRMNGIGKSLRRLNLKV